ncbi:hypothetical protein EN816_00800 [Mesorhizobium sp. M8A.F.Ca.ET.173.01.1.1]|nr:hypothetical protein EN816_00800 [Mesorhizobium sp. M8A.F.Ca.ET.173.01.1.1]
MATSSSPDAISSRQLSPHGDFGSGAGSGAGSPPAGLGAGSGWGAGPGAGSGFGSGLGGSITASVIPVPLASCLELVSAAYPRLP